MISAYHFLKRRQWVGVPCPSISCDDPRVHGCGCNHPDLFLNLFDLIGKTIDSVQDDLEWSASSHLIPYSLWASGAPWQPPISRVRQGLMNRAYDLNALLCTMNHPWGHLGMEPCAFSSAHASLCSLVSSPLAPLSPSTMPSAMRRSAETTLVMLE